MALVEAMQKRQSKRNSRRSSRDSKRENAGTYAELKTDEEGDEPVKTVVFGTFDKVNLLLLLVLPGALAITPVMFPFGNPFAKDGDNSVATNWAYYGPYDMIGWGAIWIKINLWNCELWETTFFFPFMQGQKKFFEFNKSLASTCCATMFSTAFFIGGYYIFHNPVPIGTITGGVPCFVFNFIMIYIFLVPAGKKVSLKSRMDVVRCWIPFVIWVVALCVYILITYFNRTTVADFHTQHKEWQYICGSIAVQVAFITVRETLCSLPIPWFMGVQNLDVAFLWNLGYSAQYSTFSDWLFPGMPQTPLGLTAQYSIIGANFVMSFAQFFYAHDTLGLLEVALNNFCDVVSGVAFTMIFAFNCYGPNKDYMYMIDELSDDDVPKALEMIGINFGINVLKGVVMVLLTAKVHDNEIIQEAKEFIQHALRKWYWMVVWLLVSTACACGACMVMKHDGMDFTFKFEEWEFGKKH